VKVLPSSRMLPALPLGAVTTAAPAPVAINDEGRVSDKIISLTGLLPTLEILAVYFTMSPG